VYLPGRQNKLRVGYYEGAAGKETTSGLAVD